MNWSKATRAFTHSAAACCAALAAALMVGNLANWGLTQPRDPLLGLPMDKLGWLAGFGALGVALGCGYRTRSRLKLAVVLWFALNAAIYRAGLYWEGVAEFGGYLSSFAAPFKLSGGLATSLVQGVILYLGIGSAVLLGRSVLASETTGRMACPACGGHVEFALKNRGQEIACPHCQARLTLRTEAALKMACYFCQGHIEFPSHALGTMMPCPHCRKDITLKVGRERKSGE